jgi:hypothetical protein
MAKYKMLVDHWVNNQVLPAGSIQTTQDVSASGLLPANWSPSPNTDPQDTPGVNAYYAAAQSAGVGFLLASYAFSNGMGPTMFRSPQAVTYFKPTPIAGSSAQSWQLQGLGLALAPIGG